MTATISHPFLNDRVSVHHKPETLIHTLHEFSADCANECESDCDAWGADNLVFPSDSFGDCVAFLLSDDTLKDSHSKGELHFEILEKEDGDLCDAVILKGGYLDIQQAIFFEDWPQ